MAEHEDVYPKWKYHPAEEPRLVASPEADAALGDEWSNSPAVTKPESVQDEPKTDEYAPAPKKRGRPKKAE